MVGASEIQPAVPALHQSEVNRTVDWSWSPNSHFPTRTLGVYKGLQVGLDCPGDTIVTLRNIEETSDLCR